jgi:hypothetical protein
MLCVFRLDQHDNSNSTARNNLHTLGQMVQCQLHYSACKIKTEVITDEAMKNRRLTKSRKQNG